MGKYIKIVLVIIILLLAAIFCFFSIKNKNIIYCLSVNHSGQFEKYGNNLYISRDTPSAIRDSIISLIKQADKRVCEFWDVPKKSGTPSIIYCNDKIVLSNYSNGKSIVTYKTPLGCFIVFGKESIDLDMLSHEIFHTEFFSKLGYFTSKKEIPVWFDEGLAMQVDYRNDFSEDKYIQVFDSLKPQIILADISSPESFWNANFYLHYLIARHEVDVWYRTEGINGLNKLITRINNGDNFYTVFNK